LTDVGSHTPRHAPYPGSLMHTRLGIAAQAFLLPLVAVWIFSGGFVMFEPSPYEFTFLLLLPVAVLAGVGIHRGTTGILVLLILFTPFALLGAFQVRYTPLTEALIYVIITVFLWFTGWFAANFVADAPHRNLGLVMKAYTASAVLVALVGILAYLGIIPGGDLFLRFGRAKSTFQDPNVFAPYLILPAMFALQRVLLGRGGRVWRAGFVLAILFVGVFVSFSRGAWGHLILSAGLMFALCFLLESTPRDRARMMALGLAGLGAGLVVLLALLSIEQVRDLFLDRATLFQNYDGGETGRFGRQGYAFELALANPLGIGPMEFSNLRVSEAPHNTYVKVLLSYGWLGGLAFVGLIWMTLSRGVTSVLRPSPNRLLMMPLLATFIPLAIEAAIIDIDHWRHLFLIVGLIWGVAASYDRFGPVQRDRRAALI